MLGFNTFEPFGFNSVHSWKEWEVGARIYPTIAEASAGTWASLTLLLFVLCRMTLSRTLLEYFVLKLV